MKVCLLGSAALLIEKGLSESLAGRFESHHFSHWSFGECKRVFGCDLDDFLILGGYPKAYDFVRDPSRGQSYIQGSILEPTLGRDILALHPIEKPALLRQLFGYVSRLPSQIVSYQKILEDIQGRGNAATLIHYAQLLEMGFLVQALSKYAVKPHRIKRSIPKWIILNPALVDHDVKADPKARGFLLENAVGAHLLSLASLESNARVEYWRENNREIDFVVSLNAEVLGVIEVKSGRQGSDEKDAFIRLAARQFPQTTALMIGEAELESFLSAQSLREIFPR